jgi:hypothetical protein
MLHVELIQNEWTAGRQRVVGRVLLNGSGEVSLEPVDSGWEASALLPFIDPESGDELTPTADTAERFVRALHTHLKGDYLFATEAHDAGECEYRIGEELPLNPVATEAHTVVH